MSHAPNSEDALLLGLPTDGFHAILANPPFSGRMDRDRIVEGSKVGATTATELLFLKYVPDSRAPHDRAIEARDRR